MTRKSELVDQSIQFSINLIAYYRWLCAEKREFILSRQILRSGTSIGANIHEAIYASSAADFVAKMQISLKEASETGYWFQLLEATQLLPDDFAYLEENNQALIRMLVRTINTIKTRIDNSKRKNQSQKKPTEI